MKCPRCQQDNPPQAKFCLECATPLALRCASCGTQLPSGAKFCFECAKPVSGLDSTSRLVSPDSYTPKHLAERILNSKAALEGERKQVTVLFADLKGSMELLADRDPEEARRILDPVLEHMMEAVHRYEGTVNQVMGDRIMALFGAPLAHEDHAIRACYSALRIQESVKRYAEGIFRSHGVPVEVRVGLNSGEVVVRAIGSDLHMDYTAVGQTTHLAARMEQMARPGTVLLTPETLALAEGFVQASSRGPVPVKGLAEPIEIFELTGANPVRSRLHAAAARGLTRFVGRDAELELLRQALGRAGEGRGQVVAIVGEPGVGKSRLVWEFTHSHRSQGWLVLEAASAAAILDVAHVPGGTHRRDCRYRLLRRPHPHLPVALRIPDPSTRPSRTRPCQRHRPPHRRLGRSPTGRELPGRDSAQVPAPRSGCDLRRRVRTAGERPGDERGPHRPSSALAESIRRARHRLDSTRMPRSRHRDQRMASPTSPAQVPRVLQRHSPASVPPQRQPPSTRGGNPSWRANRCDPAGR
jgi:class 3 adenylate cyclase